MSTGLLLGCDDDILQDSELEILLNGWSEFVDISNDDEDHMVSPAVHSPPLPPTTTNTPAEEMTFISDDDDDEIASSSAAPSDTISFEPCVACNTQWLHRAEILCHVLNE